MSSRQITSAEFLSVSVSSGIGPSFSPSRKPNKSRQSTSAWFVTSQTRSPPIAGVALRPISGQSCFFPDGRFELAYCHRNSPVCSSKHCRQERSTVLGNLGLRSAPLLVPINTLPCETTGELKLN